jgi:MFS family permease
MPSATIGDAPAMPPAHELTVSRPSVPALAVPGIAVRHRVALVVLGITALSFLAPSAPTYDPWAWIIWGREVLHLDLSTVDGPSWKPLPVLLTTPFALFGGLAPDLWLFVARAGAIASVVMLFRLGRRLGGVPAGVAAAVPYALAPWTVRNGAMGNSEGLLVALTLAAVERHIDGRPRAAFAFALGAALLRPEVWPFVGLYGLWLLWREPQVRALVIAGFAALPALWLLPEWWGSGDLLRAAHRAQNPRGNSPAFADDPIRAVLDQFTTMLTPVVWIGLAALVLAVLWRRWPGRRELAIVGALLIGAVLWVLEVALMTSDGFSGNIRYLVMPAAIVCLAAGVGVGWLARAVLGRRIAGTSAAALALAAAVGVGFAAPDVHHLPVDNEAVTYQARLNDDVAGLIARAGGAERLKACGDIYTAPFQVPVLAWNLHIHTSRVSSLVPVRPAVLFRVGPDPSSRPVPSLRSLGDPSDQRTLAVAPRWRIVAVCKGAA